MKEYNIGDIVWIHTGGEDLTESEIVNIFTRYGMQHYVCEVQTHIDPIYEVRDWFTISETPSGPINFWKKNA